MSILATTALTVLFLEVILDHAFGLPVWVRRTVLWSSLTGGTAYAALKVVNEIGRARWTARFRRPAQRCKSARCHEAQWIEKDHSFKVSV